MQDRSMNRKHDGRFECSSFPECSVASYRFATRSIFYLSFLLSFFIFPFSRFFTADRPSGNKRRGKKTGALPEFVRSHDPFAVFAHAVFPTDRIATARYTPKCTWNTCVLSFLINSASLELFVHRYRDMRSGRLSGERARVRTVLPIFIYFNWPSSSSDRTSLAVLPLLPVPPR